VVDADPLGYGNSRSQSGESTGSAEGTGRGVRVRSYPPGRVRSPRRRSRDTSRGEGASTIDPDHGARMPINLDCIRGHCTKLLGLGTNAVATHHVSTLSCYRS
jgi:hypothetical protein